MNRSIDIPYYHYCYYSRIKGPKIKYRNLNKRKKTRPDPGAPHVFVSSESTDENYAP